MGFYAPAQIVRDAREHGVEIRPVCINASRWDCTLEPTEIEDCFAVRLGMQMVKGLANADAAAIILARGEQPYVSAEDLWRRASVPAASLVQLADADAFRESLKLERREALWALKPLRDEPLPLFAAAAQKASIAVPEVQEPKVSLRAMTAGAEVVEDYSHLGLTPRDHPVSFLRGDLQKRRIVSCSEAMAAPDGRWLEAAGVVLVRQMPGPAKGVMFITIEDETGVANLVIWPTVFEAHRRVILTSGMLSIRGRIQREGEVVHLVARHLADLSAELASVGEREGAFPLPHGRGDEARNGGSVPDSRELPPRGFRGRNFYDPYGHIDEIKVKTRDFR